MITTVLSGCTQQTEQAEPSDSHAGSSLLNHDFPHLAAYVAHGEDLLAYEDVAIDILYTSDIDQATATELRERNPGMIILYQSPVNYMYDAAIPVLEATTAVTITDDFWLMDGEGQRCGYGWTPEMYAIDISNAENRDILVDFFSALLTYHPHYDGLFFDVVEEQSRCASLSDTEWVQHTTTLLAAIRQRIGDNIILTNAGYNYDEQTPYLPYINGYAMESFLSGGAEFEEGFDTVDLVVDHTVEPHILIYTIYGEHSIAKQPVDNESVRLGLTLSLLFNTTYLHYEERLEDVGLVSWIQESSAELGAPLGSYYEQNGTYYRDFDYGTVVSALTTATTVVFEKAHTDLTTGEISTSFTVPSGDGRIFILEGPIRKSDK